MCVLITVSQFLLLLFFLQSLPVWKDENRRQFLLKILLQVYYNSVYSRVFIQYNRPISYQTEFRFSAVLMDLDALKNICEINQVVPELLPHKQVDNDCYLYHFINMHSTSKKYTTLIMILFKLDFVFLLLFGHHISQCGNSIMFLSFRFYVKSILEILEVKNQTF